MRRASASKLAGWTSADIEKVNMRYLITPLLLIATLDGQGGDDVEVVSDTTAFVVEAKSGE